LEEKGFRKKSIIFGVIGIAAEAIRSKQLQYRCDKCDETWEPDDDEE
jgi:hypothetical protein